MRAITGRDPGGSEGTAPLSPWGPTQGAALFSRKLDSLGVQAEKATRNIAVSLNVGVVIAGVALLVATIALVVAIGRN
jgi:hypothetical protein